MCTNLLPFHKNATLKNKVCPASLPPSKKKKKKMEISKQSRTENRISTEMNATCRITFFQTALKNPNAHTLEHSWQCKLCPWSHYCFVLASLSISATPIKPPLSLSKRFSTEICRSIRSIIPAASYVSQSSSHCYCLLHRVLLCYFSSNCTRNTMYGAIQNTKQQAEHSLEMKET